VCAWNVGDDCRVSELGVLLLLARVATAKSGEQDPQSLHYSNENYMERRGGLVRQVLL